MSFSYRDRLNQSKNDTEEAVDLIIKEVGLCFNKTNSSYIYQIYNNIRSKDESINNLSIKTVIIIIFLIMTERKETSIKNIYFNKKYENIFSKLGIIDTPETRAHFYAYFSKLESNNLSKMILGG